MVEYLPYHLRGKRGMSVELLTDFLLRLSMLVSDFPQIREIDLNPVKGFDSELFSIDARINLDGAKPSRISGGS